MPGYQGVEELFRNRDQYVRRNKVLKI